METLNQNSAQTRGRALTTKSNDKFERNMITLNGLHVIFANGTLSEGNAVSLFTEAIDLVFCLAGKAKWKIGKKVYEQSPSQLLFFSSGSCYKLCSTEKDSSIIRIRYLKNHIPENLIGEKFSCFNVDCDKLKGRIQNFGMQLVDSLMDLASESGEKTHTQDDIYLEIFEQAKTVAQGIADFRENNYYCLERIFPSKPLKEKTKKAIELIAQNDNLEEFDLDLLSKQLDVSRSYLTRIFKNDLGLVPSSYLTSRKVNESLSLIQSQQSELCDVAYDLGFSDQSHFNNTFKKYLLMTPGELKKPINGFFKGFLANKIKEFSFFQ